MYQYTLIKKSVSIGNIVIIQLGFYVNSYII